MAKFTYEVYYQYNGPSDSNPLRSPKDAQEISDALRTFPEGLCHYLPDPDAEIEQRDANSGSILVIVDTVLGEGAFKEAFLRCLNDFDLFGKKVPEEEAQNSLRA